MLMKSKDLGLVFRVDLLLSHVELRDHKGVANQPVVQINHFPDSKAVLLDPLHCIFRAAPLLELLGRCHEALENANMLPSVVMRVVKHGLS